MQSKIIILSLLTALSGAAHGAPQAPTRTLAVIAQSDAGMSMRELTELLSIARQSGCGAEVKALVRQGIGSQDLDAFYDTIAEGDSWATLNECMHEKLASEVRL